MSNNPYAVNGSSQSYTNPYGNSNPYATSTSTTTTTTNPPNDPYLAQNNASSASVNSYGSRGDRSYASPNPYARPAVAQRQSPAAGSNLSGEYGIIQQTQQQPAERVAVGGYGGLGLPQPSFATRDNTSSRPTTAGTQDDSPAARQRNYSNDSRSRERRAISDARDMPPPLSTNRPPMPVQPSQNLLADNTNGVYGANSYYSPRRPVKSMDEILRHIQTNWKIMEGDECVPVKVALQLADPSSLGLGNREGDFADTHVDLQKSLKAVVNEHYADFNSAVGTYHKIQASIKESQNRVRYLKTGLAAVKGGMLTTRPELRNLAEQSGELDELLLTVNQMEVLRGIPARLEEKINEKRWIAAIEILSDALINSRKSGLEDIGAMGDLKGYFAGQENSLTDMLVEELHDHLYLKSPYCVDRWKGRKVNGGGEGDVKESFGGNAWDRPFHHFLSTLDTSKPMLEDASKNPESDTFYYIQTIVEALNRQGYLEELITQIEQRLPVELYRVVDKTNQEIDAKYPNHSRAQADGHKHKIALLHASGDNSKVLSDFLWTLYAKFEAIAESHRVLHEVVLGIVEREKLPKAEQYASSFKELWKLYQLEIRSLLHDYLATDTEIGASGGKHNAVAGDIFAKPARDKNKRMFKLSEMDQRSSDIKTEEDELEDILKTSLPGLVTKKSQSTTPRTISTRDNQEGNTAAAAAAAAAGHKLLIEPSVFNMTILLPPSLRFLQNLKEIVPATSNIPISTLTSFLDDFLINVFHPQLEEAVTELCTNNMLEYEAFMEDPQWSKYSPHPIFRGTVGFKDLVYTFSAMLSSIPQDQMFTQLIVTQLFKYYDRCYGFYKNLVSRTSQDATVNGTTTTTTTVMKAAAGFSESGALRDTVSEMWQLNPSDVSLRQELTAKEVQQLLAATKASPIQAWDIISDPKSVHQLSLIYNSMQWLAASLVQIRHVETSVKSHGRNSSLTSSHNQRRWTLITDLKKETATVAATPRPTSSSTIYLPLSPETVVPFDETLSSFRSLAQRALFTLHLDIRCGVIHQIGRCLRPSTSNGLVSPTPISPSNIRESAQPVSTTTNTTTNSQTPADSTTYPFLLTAPPTSASPSILQLTSDLTSFDANITSFLGTRERAFILTGLGRLVDRVFVVGADWIGVMNKEGVEGMRVDVLVVQQVLRGLSVNLKITSTNAAEKNGLDRASNGLGVSMNHRTTTDDEDERLSLSSRYYEFFFQGPDKIMEYVRSRRKPTRGEKKEVEYSYDELRTLIELCFSAALKGEDREEAVKARKRMGDLLLELGEVMWDT